VIQKLCAISPFLAFGAPICAFDTELQKFPTNASTVLSHSVKFRAWGLRVVNLWWYSRTTCSQTFQPSFHDTLEWTDWPTERHNPSLSLYQEPFCYS